MFVMIYGWFWEAVHAASPFLEDMIVVLDRHRYIFLWLLTCAGLWSISSFTWLASSYSSLALSDPMIITTLLIIFGFLIKWVYSFTCRYRKREFINSDGFILSSLLTFYTLICFIEFGGIFGVFVSKYLGLFSVLSISFLVLATFRILNRP